MKFYLIILLTFLSIQLQAQEARLYVQEEEHQFSDTHEGEILKHTYFITNKGDAPLIIHEYKVACPCTKLMLPKKPILPGDTFKLILSFETKGKYYLQDRVITLKTNAKKKTHKLRFKVFVIPKNEQ